MPIFESKGGVWKAKDKAAQEILEEKKKRTEIIGRKSKSSYERGYGTKGG